jgi:hypothetical protein
MICTVFAVFDPIIGRLLYFYFPPLPTPQTATLVSYLVTASVLVTLIVRERQQRVGRHVFPFMLGLATLVYALFATFARSETWKAFAQWFGELPLT